MGLNQGVTASLIVVCVTLFVRLPHFQLVPCAVLAVGPFRKSRLR